jgi:RNA polymerase sigma-70 factor (ECF subfamily)
MDDRETRIVETARTGDREACSQLFAANWRIVYGWMLGFTRDRILAEDLTQQAFLRAYTLLPQLRDPARFLPWLRKIARTVALARRPGTEVRLQPEPAGDDTAGVVEHRETERLVQNALARLSPRDRSLLLLFYVEELPLARIAALLETPLTTLRRRVARALLRFRVSVKREGGNDELP